MLFRQIEKIAATAGVLLALGSGVSADEIKVLTTGILKGSFTQIAAQFEHETGHEVMMSWGPSSGTSPEASQVRVKAGEPVNVLIMVNTGMDKLTGGGHFTPLERKDIAVSKIGVGVKKAIRCPTSQRLHPSAKPCLTPSRSGTPRGLVAHTSPTSC